MSIFKNQNLENKNIATFGDSVSAFKTINENKTYTDLLASYYKMNFLKNYAICGSTATYIYKGSNIEKDYANVQDVLDGCSVIKKAFDNSELNNLDYAFIAFGHNDLYFQVPISAKNDDEYCIDDSFKSCISFKGSYRYMINVLRKANPNIKIIILGCPYSKHLENVHPYGLDIKYADYIKAMEEIANELNCYFIKAWDYMEKYFDDKNGNIYYQDDVHLTIKGQEMLFNLIKEC